MTAFDHLLVWLVAVAALLALEAELYWAPMRRWRPEARIFAFALGAASVLLCVAGWVSGAGAYSPATVVLICLLHFAAGGLGTAAVFAHRAYEDWAPYLRRRSRHHGG